MKQKVDRSKYITVNEYKRDYMRRKPITIRAFPRKKIIQTLWQERNMSIGKVLDYQEAFIRINGRMYVDKEKIIYLTENDCKYSKVIDGRVKFYKKKPKNFF